jgi:O-antigen/teichoic acid export membrane protein
MTKEEESAETASKEGEEAAVDPKEIKRRARLGVVLLVARTIILQVLVLGGNVYLYRRLEPADFGAFAIVQFAIAFFAYFGDAGLGGALIQRKVEPTQRELSSVWWLQIFISLGVIAVVWIGAPFMVRFWPDLPARTGIWLLRALSIDLLLTALRIIPSILMERHLQFGRLTILDVVLNASFYLTAVILALLGWGVFALLGAVLVQGALGVLGAYIMRPWRPSMIFDRAAIKPILRFGIVYQAKNVFGFVTGAITPVYAGRALGQYAVGLLNWAQNTAFFPLQFVTIVSRISFPLYSRLQGDKKAFTETLEAAVQVTAIVTLAFVGAIFALGPNLIRIAFTEKWLPALPLLYIAATGISIGFLAPVVVTALDAKGMAGTTLRLSIFNTAIIWIGVPLATHFFHEKGFAGAYAGVMWVGNGLVLWVVRSILPEARLVRRIVTPMIAASVTGVVGQHFIRDFVTSWYTLPIGVLALVIVYLGTLAIIDLAGIKQAIAFIRQK